MPKDLDRFGEAVGIERYRKGLGQKEGKSDRAADLEPHAPGDDVVCPTDSEAVVSRHGRKGETGYQRDDV